MPVSIGQGYVTVTPLQLVNYINVIANRGLWVKPTMIRQVIGPDGSEMVSASVLPRQSRALPIPVEFFDPIHLGMIDAVEGHGTARRARSKKFVTAGKTGTSQVVGRAGKKVLIDSEKVDERFIPNSLFVAFAPAEDPQVSVMVIVEHGGAGSATAAPVGRKILQFYNREIEPFASTLPLIAVRDKEVRKFQRELDAAFGPSPTIVTTGEDSARDN